MSTSLYKQSVPVLVKFLGNLSAIVEKGRKFADEKGIPHEQIINYRLIEDMRALDYQVQSCCNTAKFVGPRLGGTADVAFADDEKTFDELQGRIAKTVQLLNDIKPDAFDGKEETKIVMETKVGNFGFTGQRYVSEMVIPNFHFHLSTAYCLLRAQGVPVGAMDYLKDVMVKV